MDTKLRVLFDEYIAINNNEKEGSLTEVADKIKQYQRKLLEEEGHIGIEEVKYGGC